MYMFTFMVTFSAWDAIADMLLSSLVERFQELVKLILGLATEYRQQLLVLSQRQHLGVDALRLFFAENLVLMEFYGESGMFDIESFQQEHVIFANCCRVNDFLIET